VSKKEVTHTPFRYPSEKRPAPQAMMATFVDVLSVFAISGSDGADCSVCSAGSSSIEVLVGLGLALIVFVSCGVVGFVWEEGEKYFLWGSGVEWSGFGGKKLYGWRGSVSSCFS
jgi:hypothetical protein